MIVALAPQGEIRTMERRGAMTAYTDPTVAFTRDIVAGTTAMYDALGGFAPQHTALAHRASRVHDARIVKTRLHFPRWLSASVKGVFAPTSRTPA